MKSTLSQLIVAACISIASLVGYGIWHTVISSKSVEVANLEGAILTKTEKANRLAATRTMLADIAGDEAAIREYFVPETGVVAFIDSLESHGRTLGGAVSVSSVSVDNTPALPLLTLSLTIKGTFESVMRTLGAIEYAPYALVVSELAIIQDDKNVWHADIKIIVGSQSPSITYDAP